MGAASDSCPRQEAKATTARAAFSSSRVLTARDCHPLWKPLGSHRLAHLDPSWRALLCCVYPDPPLPLLR
jgi:hypothetical protein